MNDLIHIIYSLIKTGKEGDHWDFKRQHHENTTDLVHDIICLANNLRYEGDRYLIFGVDDDCEVIGVTEEDGKIRTQADIIQILGKRDFANNNAPEILLESIELLGKRLDVLIIKDCHLKPYYLYKAIKKDAGKLKLGVIYTRRGDKNTGKDEMAPTYDVEKMWRQRFGLDLDPYTQLLNILEKPGEWQEQKEGKGWYYKQDPAFTAEIELDYRPIDSGDSWVRLALNPTAFVTKFIVRHNQTILINECCIYYDEMRYLIPAPAVGYLTAAFDSSSTNIYYYINLDRPVGKILSFLFKKTLDELIQLKGLPNRSDEPRVPIILFKNKGAHEAFKKYAKENKEKLQQINYNVRIDNLDLSRDKEISEQDLANLRSGSKILNLYNEWRTSTKK